MSIKDRVADIPRLMKISVQEFIDTVGISRTSFGKLKSGKSKPSFDTIHAILDNYNINPNWLILGKESPLLSDSGGKASKETKLDQVIDDLKKLQEDVDKLKRKE